MAGRQLTKHVLVGPPQQIALDVAQLPRFGDRDEAAVGSFGGREGRVDGGEGGEQDRHVALRGVDPGREFRLWLDGAFGQAEVDFGFADDGGRVELDFGRIVFVA